MDDFIAESNPESPPVEQPKIEIPIEPKSKPIPIRNIIIFLAVVVIGVLGLYYYMSSQSVNSIYITSNDLRYSANRYFGTYVANVSMTIGNGGNMDVILEDPQSVLYINGINVGEQNFQESWYKIPAGSSTVFTGKYATTNSNDVTSLLSTSNYNVVLTLKAKAQCGLVTEYIEKEYTETITMGPTS